MSVVAKWVVGLTGLIMVGVGASRLFALNSGPAVTALLVTGSLLLLAPLIISRIEHLSVSTSGFELALAREIADLGAAKTARILDRTDLASYAESYAFISEELRDPDFWKARVHLQDLLVERASAAARRQKFDASEVRTLFKDGSPIMRVLVLGLMEGDLSLADGATILLAITDSRAGNEQYHGLWLALQCWRSLSRSERVAVQAAVADDPYIAEDPDRHKLAEQIMLQQLT
jgi:hypothetical protein